MPHKTVGRPSGGASRAKNDIVTAAQKNFSVKGFNRTTIRDIAGDAGVDPALVMHYFGNKQKLFVETMLPLYKAPVLLDAALNAPQNERAANIRAVFTRILDDEDTIMLMTGILRAASSEPTAAAMLRDFVHRNLAQPLAKATLKPDAELRAAMFGSQLVGSMFARYIVKVEPMASASTEDIVDLLMSTFGHMLDSDTATP